MRELKINILSLCGFGIHSLSNSKITMNVNIFVIISVVLLIGVMASLAIGLFIAKRASAGRDKLVTIGPSTVSGRGAFALKKIGEGDIIVAVLPLR